ARSGGTVEDVGGGVHEIRVGGRMAAVLGLALGAAACTGVIADPSGSPGDRPGSHAPEGLALEPSTAIPRLSRREIEQTLVDVFGIEGAAIRNLPPDPLVATNPRTNAEDDVFDTFASTKVPGQVFVEG